MTRVTKAKMGSTASRPQSATTSLAGAMVSKKSIDEGGLGTLSLSAL